MLLLDCPFCKARLQSADLCRECGRDPATHISAAALPQYLDYSALPGARMARDDDDDDDKDDDDDDDGPSPKKRRSSSSSGNTAAAAGAGTAAGIGIGMIVLIVGGVLGCCVCVVALPFVAIIPLVNSVRESAIRQQSNNNLKQIGLAFHSYNDVNKTLPSLRMGNPAPDLSWRVAILPYINEQSLSQDFDGNQDFDKGKNTGLQSRMPMPYRHPNDGFGGTQTRYQCFTGPNTLFPDPAFKPRLTEITAGTTNTFLAAEAASGVTWSKAADMEVPPQGDLKMLPPDTFVAGMADASVRVINRKTDNDEALRRFMNPKGGN